MNSPLTFRDFFFSLWGYEPFPWQVALVQKIETEGKWPSPIGLPTAAGKTALMDIAIYLLATNKSHLARRRIFFVVDRRVVVDEAGERARAIARKVTQAESGPLKTIRDALVAVGGTSEVPLQTTTLRGAQIRDNTWAKSPIQPLICSTTVDQIGSKLLFNAYGCSPSMAPIHSALVAYDSLIILDEAHLSKPFTDTLYKISDYYIPRAQEPLPKPFSVVELSATPTRESAFSCGPLDKKHPVLSRRLELSKHVEFLEVENLSKKIAAECKTLVTKREDVKVVGVILNTVKEARKTWKELKKSFPDAHCLLFHGQSRGFDRNLLWQQWKPHIEAQPNRPAPEELIFVVGTQCIEAGANIDFDFLITEYAPLDVLKQRFGRLNRMGNHEAVYAIIVRLTKKEKKENKTKKKKKADKPNPIYGEALENTWNWLKAQGELDFAYNNIQKVAPNIQERPDLYSPPNFAASLLPSHLDFLCQTEKDPYPDLAPFLKGTNRQLPKVSIVWRDALNNEPEANWETLVSVCPASSLEIAEVPLYAARAWLMGKQQVVIEEDTDLFHQTNIPPAKANVPNVLMRTPDGMTVVNPKSILPNSTIFLPSQRGGCDEWGWNAESTEPVKDISQECALLSKGRFIYYTRSSKLAAIFENPEDEDYLNHIQAAVLALDTKSPVLQKISQYPKTIEPHFFPSTNGVEGKLFAITSSKRLRPEQVTNLVKDPLGASLEMEESYFRPNRNISLEQHQNGVTQKAKYFAEMIFGKNHYLVAELTQSGEFHDIGKLDPRMQSFFYKGDSIKAQTKPPLAKAYIPPHLEAAIREQSGFVKGIRHEALSVALLEGDPEVSDFVRHIIASHHGYARPCLPSAPETTKVDITYTTKRGVVKTISSQHGLSNLDSPVPVRFWKLCRHYGWWGLAYLEMIFRLADHRQSEEEQASKSS